MHIRIGKVMDVQTMVRATRPALMAVTFKSKAAGLLPVPSIPPGRILRVGRIRRAAHMIALPLTITVKATKRAALR
jgi:hypothetical protein